MSRNPEFQSPLDVLPRQNERGSEGDQTGSDEEHDELHRLAHHGHHPPQREVSIATHSSRAICVSGITSRPEEPICLPSSANQVTSKP